MASKAEAEHTVTKIIEEALEVYIEVDWYISVKTTIIEKYIL